ncbi:hypothetical protein [Cohnella lubricantis]|uniref:Uncharacterized protein n=2 Tax=Cohnella lubricantis TaxID=2163172 RepID=A0A841T742_9BACL|nr:hypothetical protein [Cohnella lubricantis]MBB6675866.1 hypothetical protein [Cohnella lubricantis]MBP2117222.1 hypothetical protein [Cohnella lubricantis]
MFAVSASRVWLRIARLHTRAVIPMLLKQVEFTKSPRHPDMMWTADPVPGPSEKWTVRAARRT